MSLVGGTLSAEHAEELGIFLTEEVNLLAVLLAESLPQRAQGHRGHEGLCLLFFSAERTEQDPAGGLGPHVVGWGEAELAKDVSTGRSHCILQGPLAGRTGSPLVGGG